MKKLFFTALVAVVAIGGAFSVNAADVYTKDNGSGGTLISCNGGSIQCTDLVSKVYSEQFIPQGAPLTLSQLSGTYRIN